MSTPPQSTRLFRSYWIAGYEGADHINGSGRALIMNDITGHSADPAADYERLRDFDIRTVRESVGWRITEEAGGRFHFDTLEKRAKIAQQCGVQVVWTLMHYGYPADVDIFSPQFIDRFARYCREVARVLAPYSDQPVYSPINEISFLSWAICESALFHPYTGTLKECGFELKKHLVRASIAGCEAIWDADPRARIVQIDPLIYVVAAEPDPELIAAAARENEIQFQAWDLLRGSLEPELGGAPKYLDIVGINYYHSNQWEIPTDERLHWHRRDPRRVPFSYLLKQASDRYQRPIFIAETSHVGSGRCEWIREITEEVIQAEKQGVPLEGICLYPIIDRPDWENPDHWHNSGLWDRVLTADGTFQHVLHEPYAHELKRAQRLIAAALDQERFLPTQSTEGNKPMTAILVFSHLRWNFVYQRPQHLLSRLAENYRIYFIEEPVFDQASSFLEIQQPATNVRVLKPHTSLRSPGFSDEQLPTLQRLVQQFIADEQLEDYVVWFYTPMALPLLQQTRPRAIVYDCMDELSAFKNAPKQLLQRESALLKLASVVFTGGPSLYRAKRSRHPSVHCFPSSVDSAHFSQGSDRRNEHSALEGLPKPRLGFYGVIDERLDLDLIARLADERPDWQITLVGPVVKIKEDSLPRRSNLHYFGQTPYAELPRFLAGWDVALMPFALNDSTRFISPTKTLEYMAADLPIVSTPITDVAEPYGEIVYIANDAETFIDCCERALAESAEQRARRSAMMREALGGTSWDATARQMHELIQTACANGLNPAALALWEQSFPAPAAEVPENTRPTKGDYDSIIVGAGPTGLSAAYHLGERTLLLDQNATSAAGAAPSKTRDSPSITPVTSCSPTTPTCRNSTRRCSATTCTGRIGKPGSTARTSIPAIRSRAHCTACRRKC
jgi:UDP-galactopyranose mutase